MDSPDVLLSRLRADARYDAAVLTIGEADYGCEERPEGAPERVFLRLLLSDGTERCLEPPAALVDGLGLQEGSFCRLADLTPGKGGAV